MKTVADVGGNVLLDYVAQKNRQGGGDSYQYPKHGREGHARNRDRLERDRNGVGLAEADVQREDVGDKLDPVNDNCCQKESHNRKSADDDEKNVDRAGDGLAAAAMGALDEMLFVIGTHGRREAGDVISPAGEDVSYNLIRAGGRMQAAVGGG